MKMEMDVAATTPGHCLPQFAIARIVAGKSFG
jgi:hypothetical protein